MAMPDPAAVSGWNGPVPLGRPNRRYHACVAKVVVLHPFFGREKRSGYERAA
ncbi:hypothetical protein [Corynebacterium glucuronolyticum]|uniref:Uncharacterized protein n=2 Tax=Corynebacterium glucuronolyticum TaxID=39791 RepID=A0AAX1LD73_9CORY|nr:hypothetical protein [Corynebacterium glucuronolyticum]QRO83888.1 hypothetical protein I6J20_02755 [Corynebacterium glucuronolyticum]QRP71962.1 hypothetical protein I6J21_07400 [Corynebacterium glucuronolyticum]